VGEHEQDEGQQGLGRESLGASVVIGGVKGSQVETLDSLGNPPGMVVFWEGGIELQKVRVLLVPGGNLEGATSGGLASAAAFA
jgi:hypothetical protein